MTPAKLGGAGLRQPVNSRDCLLDRAILTRVIGRDCQAIGRGNDRPWVDSPRVTMELFTGRAEALPHG